MGWVKKFIFFTVLADREEIDQLSSYDRSLIYASFVRQALGALFAFMVFFYAWSTVLPLWIAAIISIVLAAIIFFLDQAIVGSEWSLHRDFSRHWFVNGPVSFVVKLIQLLPRIAYAVAIAWFMATLAEIALQSRAIDRVLNERTRANNSVYFERTDELNRQHNDALSEMDEEISDLESTIRTRSDPTAERTITLLETEVDEASNTITTLSNTIQSLQQRMQQDQDEALRLESRVTILRGEISSLQDTMDAEVNDPARCRTPGSDLCEGDRWREARDDLIPLQNSLGPLEAALSAVSDRIESTEEAIEEAEAAILVARGRVSTATGELQQTQRATSSVGELQEELAALVAARSALVTAQGLEMSQLEQTLISTGNRDFADYGPLDRRIGLQILHEHPEYGAVAKQFSWELKIVVILFELSPVLVTIFFAPFSFLSLKMRQKRDVVLAEDHKKRSEREVEAVRSEAKREVDAHEEQSDASLKISQKDRSTKLSQARDIDAHEEEMFALEKKRLEREAALAEHKQQTSPPPFTDDEELQEIEREIHKETRRQEWLRARRLTEMLTRKTKNETRRYANGEENDQDSIRQEDSET